MIPDIHVRWASRLALVLVAVVGSGSTAHAQCTTPTSGANAGNCNFDIGLWRVPTLNRLTTTTTALSLAPSGGAITAADMALGYAAGATALTVTVETNAGGNTLATPTAATSVKLTWQISSAAWSGTGCPFTPSDLTYSTSVNGTFAAVPTVATTLLSGLTSTSTLAQRQVTLYFRTTVAWSDAPAASCTLPIQFTVSP